jgi:hypothetical protein
VLLQLAIAASVITCGEQPQLFATWTLLHKQCIACLYALIDRIV